MTWLLNSSERWRKLLRFNSKKILFTLLHTWLPVKGFLHVVLYFCRQEDRRCNEAKKPGINKLKLLKYVRDTLKKYVYTPQVSSFLSFPFLTLGLAHDVLLQIAFTRRNVGLRNFECHNGTRASLSYNSIITARSCFSLTFSCFFTGVACALARQKSSES